MITAIAIAAATDSEIVIVRRPLLDMPGRAAKRVPGDREQRFFRAQLAKG